MRTLLTLFLLLGALTMPTAATAAAPLPQLTRLSNGLTVLIQPDERFPLASLRLYVHAGSTYETPREAGISHVLEHMVFKGTENRPKGAVARDVERAGGYLNAATSFDYTVYLTDMPAAQWKLGMEVLKDMAFHPTLDPAELESEKDVILAELQRGEDSPDNRLFQHMQALTLNGTPYASPIIGLRETITSFTANDIRDYIRRHYQPQSMLLAVVGNVNPAEALTEAQRLFGDLKNDATVTPPAPIDAEKLLAQPLILIDGGKADGGKTAAPASAKSEKTAKPAKTEKTEKAAKPSAAAAPVTPVTPVTPVPTVKIEPGPWNKVYLGISFPAPGFGDVQSPQLDVLAHLLGGDRTSLLYRTYKYEKQLVDSISVSNYSFERVGMLYLTAELDADKLDEFWTALTADLATLSASRFTAEDIDRAKLNLEDDMFRAKETLPGLASKLGYFQFFTGLQGETNYLRGLHDVTPAMLQDLIARWLRPERLSVVALTPEKSQTPDLAATLAKAWPAPARAGADAASAAVTDKTEVIDLGKGRTLILMPDATLPYTAVDMVFSGGNALLPADKQGLASLAASALLKGTLPTPQSAGAKAAGIAGGLDAPSMEAYQSDRAASMGASAGRQTFSLSLRQPARFNDDMFALLGQVLSAPAFADAEVARERVNQVAAIKAREDQPMGLAFRHLTPFLFPGHTYGYYHLGMPEAVQKFGVADVRGFWAQQARQPWVMAVCGQYDREAVIRHAKELPAPDAKPASLSAPDWNKDKGLDLHLPGRNQAHLMLVFPTAPLKSDDTPGLELMQTILSGQSGLLFRDLRDEQGLGYTVTAMNWQSEQAGFMIFYIGTEPGKLDQATQGFKDVIARLHADRLPDDELRRGKNQLEGDYYREHQRLGSRSSEAAVLTSQGYPLAFNKQVVDKAAKLDAEALRALARKYLKVDGAYTVRVLP
ncbi:pitrilysin family protein [Nitratidesulfovibrio sp. HK-II]|uniref:M16 family metallopeptidase n=1 Tax=Nitratidesulfovibrio sp. HK-II TaxID=2009266 RepID=UPI000E2F9F90